MFARNHVPVDRVHVNGAGADEGRRRTRTVVVEVDQGDVRIREASPDVLVMVVESREVPEGGKRSVAAGGRAGSDGLLSPAPEDRAPVRVRQIPVSFPG